MGALSPLNVQSRSFLIKRTSLLHSSFLLNMIISLCRTHLLRRHIPNDLTVRCRRIVAVVVAAEVDAKFTLLQNSHHIIQQTRCFASEDIIQPPKLAYELIVDGKVIPQSKVSIHHGSGGAKIEEDGKEVVVFLHGLLGNAKVCISILLFFVSHILQCSSKR